MIETVRRFGIALGMIGPIILAGCAKPESESMVSSENDRAAESVQTVDVADVAADPSEPTASDDSPTVAPEIESTEKQAIAPELVGPLPMDPPGHHRLWIPTTAGPLLIDLEVFIGNVPLADVYDEKLNAVMEKVRGDQKGSLSWRSALSNIRDDPNFFGPTVVSAAESVADVTRRYDINRNKRVDRDELAKLVFQTSGFWSAFRVRGTAAFRQINRSGSPLWKAIDGDDDGVLSAQERDQAGPSLMANLDSSGDRRIDLTEVTTNAVSPTDQPWNTRRTHRRGDVAMDLDGFIDWQSIAFSIDRTFPVNSIGIRRDFRQKIDADRDDQIDTDEAKRLANMTADYRFAIRFADESGAAPVVSLLPRISLVDQPEVAIRSALSGSAVVVQGERFEFWMVAIDRSADAGYAAQNAGGGMAAPLAAVQVRGRAAEFPDAVFAWLDADNDQSLSTREIMAAGPRMAASAIASPSDFPDSVLIQLGRGMPGQDDALFSMSGISAFVSNGTGNDDGNGPANDQRPNWAIRMDANGDGDIAEDEFVGPLDQFKRLDRNNDRFLDSDEVDSDEVDMRAHVDESR